MKARLVAVLLSGFAMSSAWAQTTVPPALQQSVLMVLATALPSDSVSFALASQSAFASQIASSLAAGATPAWYQSLPGDVKSLLPVIYKAGPTSSSNASKTATAVKTLAHSSSSSSASSASSSSSSSSSSSPASPAAASNAAAMPRAATGVGVGVGIGGVVALGFIGLLAL